MQPPATTIAAPRRRFPRPLAFVATSLLVIVGSYAATAFRSSGGPGSMTPRAAVPAATDVTDAGGVQVDLERIGAGIATWSANLERDPADFIAAVNLSTLYLARAQLTASPDDHDRALRAVDQALAIDPTLLAARIHRARVLFASHDFAGAADAATELLADDPTQPAVLAVLGDARLELGDIDGAAEAYADIPGPTTAPLLARQARLSALTGSLDAGRSLAADASALALDDPDASAADRSFYHLLEGSLAFQAGDLRASLAAYRSALAALPGSPQALVALGRAKAATGDLDGAIASLERAVAIRPEPEALAILGDVLAVAGRAAEAETRHAQVRGIAAIEREAGLFNRAIVRFLADHGEAPDEAVALAEAELELRTDVYGWDAYAWALYAAGRHAEADAAIARARTHGTEDAVLDYHAGMIAAALGRRDEAADLLRSALDRNPAFSPVQAERARQALAELEAER